ncbi:hypothetical protein NPIL_346221, partial [Nephila pilipes]
TDRLSTFGDDGLVLVERQHISAQNDDMLKGFSKGIHTNLVQKSRNVPKSKVNLTISSTKAAKVDFRSCNHMMYPSQETRSVCKVHRFGLALLNCNFHRDGRRVTHNTSCNNRLFPTTPHISPDPTEEVRGSSKILVFKNEVCSYETDWLVRIIKRRGWTSRFERYKKVDLGSIEWPPEAKNQHIHVKLYKFSKIPPITTEK